MSEWKRMTDELPPDGVEVLTKIDDGGRVRNVQTLKRSGNLFFVPDYAVYVYYTPTHWRPVSSEEA